MNRSIARLVLAVLAGMQTACTLDPEIVRIWGGDASAPRMLGLETMSETGLRATFSREVTVLDAAVSVPSPVAAEGTETLGTSWTAALEADGTFSVMFAVAGSPGVGLRAVLSGTVRDGHGNTLSFAVPYTGYNPRPASLRLNEIRISYSKPKVEFIELFALSDGNLGGIEIRNERNEDNPSYEFPPAEVKAGDFIVWHLRTVEEGLVDELDGTDSSAGAETRSDARDFWSNLTRSPLKGDNVIMVKNRKDGAIMDAVHLVSAGLADWPTDELRKAAALTVAAGAWKGGSSIADAVSTDGMTPTRTVGRTSLTADSDTAVDWVICDKSKCTPGFANVSQ